MSGSLFLYELPPSVRWAFCRVMDGLSDLDWTRFASEVLSDHTDVRLAERKDRRTDWVMVHLENRNQTVDFLCNVLERLHLLRPRNILLLSSSPNQSTSSPPPHPPAALSQFDPPPNRPQAPPTYSSMSTAVNRVVGGAKALPGPAPPPSYLQSVVQDDVSDDIINSAPLSVCCGGALQWSFEEVHAGTEGFSSALQIGEGGFGVVYRALLRNVRCAVKRFRCADQSEDCMLDWTQLRESFRTEVEKLSQFRHPHILDLMGFSEGGEEMCLIYSFMDNKSLEDQLHNECVLLSWDQRIRIMEEASAALQFLHSSPKPVIHGDVKSSNILLDRHMVAKLSDFGLARFSTHSTSGGSSVSATQTASLGKTASLQGTLAYLPEDYLRNRVLSTAVDVFSFGVVLLEVLSGRRAMEKDQKSRERYLKDVMMQLQDPADGAEDWRPQLDPRLTAGGRAEPTHWQEVVVLAWKTLNTSRRKRPKMMEVFEKLKAVHESLGTGSVDTLCQHFSKLGDSEKTDTCCSSSSSSPHPLHCSSSLPASSAISSLGGPCETDESRGFSQFHLDAKDTLASQHHGAAEPSEARNQFPRLRTLPDPDTRGQNVAGAQGYSVMVNPSKATGRRTSQYEEGLIGTPELLSCSDIYGDVSREDFRDPEESDELDYLGMK